MVEVLQNWRYFERSFDADVLTEKKSFGSYRIQKIWAKLESGKRFSKKRDEQNQNLFDLGYRQLLFQFFLWIFWMSWYFVRFQEILNKTDAEYFSCLSILTNKIVLFLKNIYDRSQEWTGFNNYQNNHLCLSIQFLSEDFEQNLLFLLFFMTFHESTFLNNRVDATLCVQLSTI